MAKMGGGEGHARGNMVGILLIRFFLGGIFLYSGLLHIIASKAFIMSFTQQVGKSGQFMLHNSCPFFQNFLQQAVAPYAASVAWILIAMELIIGLLLLLGFLTRVGALLVILFSVFFLLATMHLGDLYATTWGATIVMALAVMIAAAGRTWGVDALLASHTMEVPVLSAKLPVERLPGFDAIPGLRHALSTRSGGVSVGAFAALNLGYHVGDDPARVTENRRRFATTAGYPAAQLVCAQQVHGTRIARVDAVDHGRGAFGWEDAIPATDGLLTMEENVPVAILTADCAAVLLVDPVRHALAVIHAGWRGAVGGIVGNAVRALGAFAGSRPDDLRIGIGPSLCTRCFEIGDEVATAVTADFANAVIRTGTQKPHLDLAEVLRMDLARAGVEGAQVVGPIACTRCCGDRYFSHRGQQGQAGRLALVAWWSARRQ